MPTLTLQSKYSKTDQATLEKAAADPDAKVAVLKLDSYLAGAGGTQARVADLLKTLTAAGGAAAAKVFDGKELVRAEPKKK